MKFVIEACERRNIIARFPQYLELRMTQQCNLQRFYRDTGLKVILNTSRTLVIGFYCCFRTYVLAKSLY